MRNRIQTAPRKPEAEAQKPEGEDKCCHYWVIDSPNGPTSRGVCKFCGTENYFHNTPPEFLLSKQDTRKSELPGPPDKDHNRKKDESYVKSK